jgi:hypothetical protein
LLAKPNPAAAGTARFATAKSFGVSPSSGNLTLLVSQDLVKTADRFLECLLQPCLAVGVAFTRVLTNAAIATFVGSAPATGTAGCRITFATTHGAICTACTTNTAGSGNRAADAANSAAVTTTTTGSTAATSGATATR